MTTEFQQQLAGGLCNPEAMKAFGQMYNTHGAYEKQYQMFPFFAQHFAPYSTGATSAFSPASSTSSTSSNNNQPTKKKPVPVPDEQKDDSYYERRRRNNQAAKKSRESKRKQDNDNELRVRALAEENAYLRLQLNTMGAEIERLKYQLGLQISASLGSVDTTNAGIPQF